MLIFHVTDEGSLVQARYVVPITYCTINDKKKYFNGNFYKFNKNDKKMEKKKKEKKLQ